MKFPGNWSGGGLAGAVLGGAGALVLLLGGYLGWSAMRGGEENAAITLPASPPATGGAAEREAKAAAPPTEEDAGAAPAQEGAEQKAGAGQRTPAIAGAPSGEADSPAVAPRLDLVRVEADGSAVIAGQAAPGARVQIMLDEVLARQVTADSSGNFVVLMQMGLSDRPRVLSLLAEDGAGGERGSPDSAIIQPVRQVAAAPAPPRLVSGALQTAEASEAAALAAGGEVSDGGPAPAPVASASAQPPGESEAASAAPASGGGEQVGPAPAEALTVAEAPVPVPVPVGGTDPSALAGASRGGGRTGGVAAGVADGMATARSAERAQEAARTPPREVPLPVPGARPPAGEAGAATGSSATGSADGVSAAAPALAAQPTVTESPPASGAGGGPAAAGRDGGAAPRVMIANEEGIRVVQGGGRGPEALENVTLDAITYDSRGEVSLSGRGGGRGRHGDSVRIYLDNRPILTTTITEDGQWRTSLPEVESGIYTLRIDQLGADGTVTSRIETPFKREDVAQLAAVAAEVAASGEGGAGDAQAGPVTPATPPVAPGAAPGAPADTAPAPARAPRVRAITVQPHDTLWQIATETYGEGILYVRVFEANRDQIRDPDLIYPGQVFALPE